MKKVFIVLLTLALVLSTIGCVSAEEATTKDIHETDINPTSNTATHSATVTLTLEELFTVTLPSEFVLELNDDKDAYTDLGEVSVDVIRLDPGHSLSIAVSSENSNSGDSTWQLIQMEKTEMSGEVTYTKITDGKKLPYYLGLGPSGVHVGQTGNIPIINGNNFVDKIDEDYSSMYIHAKLPVPSDEQIKSGIYQDQLTFTITLNTATQGSTE